jgi:FkbM family methyltransferase
MSLVHRIRYSARIIRTCRNWPQVGSKMALGYLGLGGRELTLRSRDGVCLSAPNRRDARWPMFEVLVGDAYGLDDLAPSNQGESFSVLDIGAQVGSFACSLAMRMPRAMVTCYEPSHGASQWLQRNVRANGLSECIDLVECAVGAEEGSATLYEPGEASGRSSLLMHTEGNDSTTTVVTLATAIGGMKVPPKILKMDCEGSEYDIVLSAPETCWDGIEYVVFEYHVVAGYTYSSLRDRLATLGFEQKWMVAGRRGRGDGVACFWRTPTGSARVPAQTSSQ